MDGCGSGLKGDLCKTACSPGEYGRNCQFRCSDHCHNNEVCNPFFGDCSKCANGFQNAKCNEQCDDGNYGESCLLQCGHCLDDITCNNTDGTCPGGCISGWQNTDKCDKLGSTQDSNTPYVAVIGILVVIIVALITVLTVRNAHKTNKTNKRVNEIDMYDSPIAKPAASGVIEAWLRIDLQTVKSIKSVKFWYRNDLDNLNCSQFCHDKFCSGSTGECVDGCEDRYLGGICIIRKISALCTIVNAQSGIRQPAPATSDSPRVLSPEATSGHIRLVCNMSVC
uniref:Tyrosine-protein kinase receptor Tie-1 n=1 Tax=Magallana gigas TaxID=29159 RepID=K1QND4_MAGGI